MAKLLNINKDNKDVDTLYIIPENISDNVQGLLNNYLLPLPKDVRTKIVFVSVFVPKKGVLKKNILLEELEEVNKVLSIYDIKNIVVCNVNYYKFFLKANKKPEFERDIGSVKVIEYNGVKYNLTPQINHIVLNFQPNKKKLLDVGNNLIQELLQGTYVDNTKEYLESLDIRLLKDVKTVKAYLNKALNQPLLTCDIEATGLKWFVDDLLTISFSVNDKVGFSIPLHKVYTDDWEELRQVVKQFVIDYKGELIFHNASYDVPFLVYHLFMNDVTDTKNMIYGVNQFNVGDTMIMAWLCLNNVDKPKLGLKHLAYHKFGNWDDDINQSKLITYPFEKVGTYNTIDTFATLEIYNKYYKQLVEEGLEDLYNNFYRPFLKGLMKMKMNGITLNKQGFEELKDKFETMYDELYNELMSFEQVQETETILKYIELSKRNARLKTKQLTIDEINFKFNPKSSNQVRILLFQVMGLPEQEKSKDTGQPKTDKDTINKLLAMLKEGSDEFRIVQILQEIGEMKTVKSTFVDGLLEQGIEDSEGNFKIFGNFNINGTVSGRLSSSNPLY